MDHLIQAAIALASSADVIGFNLIITLKLFLRPALNP